MRKTIHRRVAVAVAISGAILSGCAGPGPGTSGPSPTSSAAAESSPALGRAGAGSTPTGAPSAQEASGPPADRVNRTAGPAKLSDSKQSKLDEQLRAAAWKNDVKRAASLIKRGADVNAKDSTQQSAYLVATSEGYLELLRLTLANGARINDKDSWNGTGLIRAAERGHGLVVGELLQAEIDRNHVNRIGYQALHEAVWLGENTSDYATTVRVLVAGGAELTKPSGREGLTPLQLARRIGHPRLETVLAKAAKADRVTQPNRELLAAAADGDADLVALALRAGASIEARDRQNRTALLLAVTADHVATAQLLVAVGANADALDDRYDTPWLVTGVTGNVAMLEALLPAEPDLGIVNRYGGTSVIPASERGHADYVARVVKTGIDIDHVNRLGWTALLEAVILGDGGTDHQRIVETLLDAGADRSIADKDGVTALEHAKAKGHHKVVRLLSR